MNNLCIRACNWFEIQIFFEWRIEKKNNIRFLFFIVVVAVFALMNYYYSYWYLFNYFVSFFFFVLIIVRIAYALNCWLEIRTNHRFIDCAHYIHRWWAANKKWICLKKKQNLWTLKIPSHPGRWPFLKCSLNNVCAIANWKCKNFVFEMKW